MAKIIETKSREEAVEAMTWDLSSLYSSDLEWEDAFANAQEEMLLIKQMEGSLATSSKQFQHVVDSLLAFNRHLENIYVYSHLKNDQDTNNDFYQQMHNRSSSLLAQASQASAWFKPEYLLLDRAQVDQFMAENPELEIYRHLFEQMDQSREHTLSQEVENVLAATTEVFQASSKTFSLLNNADLKFPMVHDEEGNEIQLTHGNYGLLLQSRKREVRQEAFTELYKTYDDIKNTTASTLSSHIKGHNVKATLRHYPSARALALAANDIPETVYDTLLQVVNDNLPLLHQYYALRKEVMRLDELHMYDIYTSITGEEPLKFTYEEAKEVTLKALAPLGEDYLQIIQKAFNERWIDVYENTGKRSGAYSSGSYDSNPYILLNWQDSLNDLYTLVHELGHSVHSYLTHQNQQYVYGDYSIFLAEIASTTNENLLTDYLLKTYPEYDVRLFVLNQYLDGFKGTIFRQTQFAEFEQLMHVADAEGTPLTQTWLQEQYLQLNQKYYGESVHSDAQIALEWSRIPHFYYNFYVYQYATGFSAATALTDKILNEGQTAVDSYLEYLKSGSSNYPIEVMKKAGVDMTDGSYIKAAMEVFKKRLNELELLLNQ